MSERALVRLSDMRGHERVRDGLRAAVANDRLPHALLFAGPDGIGKRSVALALAAWLQCEEDGDDACRRCASCLQIAAGSHPDVQLVGVAEGKKEIGVDRARDVKRFTQLQPLRGVAKVAIINDAHRLTIAAQNALLKTLEEPPQRSVLILVANNSDALLPTVRSRCQRVPFAPLSTAMVTDILIDCGIDAAAAPDLAAVADGSPGRALALGSALAGESRARLSSQLAGLSSARYVALVQLASELGTPEKEVSLKLEMILAKYRDDAAEKIAGGAHDVRSILRRAEVVQEAWHAVRRSNPNRPLLLEALLLRLARE